MRNSAPETPAPVTARLCASCRGSMEGRRSDARFCSAACKQEGWRVPAQEVAPDVWHARGARWTLALGAGGYELRSDSETRRPPWPMTHQQARAWARMTLSTPKETA